MPDALPKTSMLALSRVHYPVSALGPGRRIGIWFQGCDRRCAGCISADTWAFAEPSLSLEDLMQALAPWLAACDGITITGGEPLAQFDALAALVHRLKAENPKSILLYTGQTYDAACPQLAALSPSIDAAVCGPYEAGLPQTLALRGSDNQTLHCLTPLGEREFASYERILQPEDKTLDVMLDDDGTAWLAGIPRRGDIHNLTRLLDARAGMNGIEKFSQRKGME
ncbi:MAG: radical SAM protein [Azoarcus sp.]|nr:radical SAM protein [Azoarcus sp.]